jgi:hypothetical protein
MRKKYKTLGRRNTFASLPGKRKERKKSANRKSIIRFDRTKQSTTSITQCKHTHVALFSLFTSSTLDGTYLVGLLFRWLSKIWWKRPLLYGFIGNRGYHNLLWFLPIPLNWSGVSIYAPLALSHSLWFMKSKRSISEEYPSFRVWKSCKIFPYFE